MSMNKQVEVSFGGPSFQSRRLPTQRERFLMEMEQALPWAKLRGLVAPVYADPRRVRGNPLELDRMLRVYFLQRWFHLSDAAVREELLDSRAMRAFACVGLAPDRAPEEISICGFRQLLEEFGLGNAIVDAAERHLWEQGMAVSPGAIVDATLSRARSAQARGQAGDVPNPVSH